MVLASSDLWAVAEAVIYELCSGLDKHTHIEVTAVFLNEGVLADRCREAGISVNILDGKVKILCPCRACREPCPLDTAPRHSCASI